MSSDISGWLRDKNLFFGHGDELGLMSLEGPEMSLDGGRMSQFGHRLSVAEKPQPFGPRRRRRQS